jgi:hypothetical protein
LRDKSGPARRILCDINSCRSNQWENGKEHKSDIQEENMQKFDYQRKRRTALPEFISVISANKCAKIKIDDIEVIEQDGRKVHVITAAKDYSFYGGIDTIVGSLAERAFYRPIKRLIINLDHISDISNYSVNFNSGQSVALGKNALLNTRKAYKRYLLRYPPYTIWEPVEMHAAYVSESDDYIGEKLMPGAKMSGKTAPKMAERKGDNLF